MYFPCWADNKPQKLLRTHELALVVKASRCSTLENRRRTKSHLKSLVYSWTKCGRTFPRLVLSVCVSVLYSIVGHSPFLPQLSLPPSSVLQPLPRCPLSLTVLYLSSFLCSCCFIWLPDLSSVISVHPLHFDVSPHTATKTRPLLTLHHLSFFSLCNISIPNPVHTFCCHVSGFIIYVFTYRPCYVTVIVMCSGAVMRKQI